MSIVSQYDIGVHRYKRAQAALDWIFNPCMKKITSYQALCQVKASAKAFIQLTKPSKVYDDYNAYQYIELLESKGKASFGETRKLLLRTKA